MQTIVAHYRKPVALTIALAMIALAVCGIYIIFYPPSWHPADMDAPILRRSRNALMILVVPLLIVRYGLYLRQIFFRANAAIWVDESAIHFLDSSWRAWPIKIGCNEVADTSIGQTDYGGQRAIIIKARGGRSWTIRAWELLEPAESVVASLRRLTNLNAR